MKIDNPIIQATIERYQQREQQRAGYLQKLQETGILSADTPERVAMRLERIARHPLTPMTIDRPPVANFGWNRIIEEQCHSETIAAIFSRSMARFGNRKWANRELNGWRMKE